MMLYFFRINRELGNRISDYEYTTITTQQVSDAAYLMNKNNL